jgi:hypothetical protein
LKDAERHKLILERERMGFDEELEREKLAQQLNIVSLRYDAWISRNVGSNDL